MPQSGGNAAENKVILIAQADSSGNIQLAQAGGEHGAPAGGGEHAGVEGAGHAGAHEPVNPLKEHEAYYYSIIGFIIAALLILVTGSLVRKRSVRNPGRGQLLMEQAVASMRHFCRAAIGPGGEGYAPFVGTLFAFVLGCNLCGVLPFYWVPGHEKGAAPLSFTPAPTANLSMTFALGLIVFGVFNWAGIKANGFGGHMKHFMGPIPALAPLIFPIELVGMLVRPISLAMRLFGNVFGEETVIAVLIGLVSAFFLPLHTPMLAFGVFGSIVQAGVFAILTCSYIALSVGDHGHDEHGEHGHDEHGHAEHGAVAAAH